MTTKAIIIAAGRGRRLAPYTDEMPKCLVPVTGDRTIAGIQLDALRAHGVDEVVFIRGYLGDVLAARAGELGDPGSIRFVDNPDWEHNNILESLFCAAAELDGPVLLSYSDIVFTPDVVGRLMASGADFGLVVDRDFRSIYEGRTEHPLSEAEVCDLDGAGFVARVGKRALPAEEAWGEFIGLARLSAAGARTFLRAWAELGDRYRGREQQPFQRAPSFRQAYLTDLLQHLIDGGVRMAPVEIRGQWREIDTVQDLERARALLSSVQETWT
jgi:choline kinase